MFLSNGALKHDHGKTRMGLLPPEALTAIAEVFTFGAEKYGVDNWRHGMAWSRLYDALLRHLFAWQAGEETDAESGRPHLAHAGCCLLMLLSYAVNPEDYGSRDDRWTSLPPRALKAHIPQPPMGG